MKFWKNLKKITDFSWCATYQKKGEVIQNLILIKWVKVFFSREKYWKFSTDTDQDTLKNVYFSVNNAYPPPYKKNSSNLQESQELSGLLHTQKLKSVKILKTFTHVIRLDFSCPKKNLNFCSCEFFFLALLIDRSLGPKVLMCFIKRFNITQL